MDEILVDIDDGNVVLIETYWNVNALKCTSKTQSYFVLIETYWNVNTFESGSGTSGLGINRNILECKYTLTARDQECIKY